MPRGRQRDEDAQKRILDAAFELVGDGDPGTVTVDDIAKHAAVAKQTIYRWWPSRTAVVLDALVVGTMKATKFPDTDDVRSDFERHLKSVVKLFNSQTGSLIRELVADAQSDAAIAAEFRDRFWGPRRALALERLKHGIEIGQIRSDIDHEVVLDAIYGPLWTRLLIDHRRLRPSDATKVLNVLWAGIAAD